MVHIVPLSSRTDYTDFHSANILFALIKWVNGGQQNNTVRSKTSSERVVVLVCQWIALHPVPFQALYVSSGVWELLAALARHLPRLSRQVFLH